MKSDMKVSVIVPCWNYGVFLRECLDSLLNQTHPLEKIIITDDASTDETSLICAEYKALFPDVIEVIRNTERLGTIINENNATELVTTPWFFFLDADDYVDERYVEKCLSAISNDKIAVVYSDMMRVGLWDGLWQMKPWDINQLRASNYINGHSLIKTEVFREAGKLREHPTEDWDLWLRFADMGYIGAYVPEPLVYYRRHNLGHRTDGSDIITRT
jgi:glycosyltransferase involved in cell wall biosynthesis